MNGASGRQSWQINKINKIDAWVAGIRPLAQWWSRFAVRRLNERHVFGLIS